jgi:hypothetical protein
MASTIITSKNTMSNKYEYIKGKLYTNKANNQLSIVLSRKSIPNLDITKLKDIEIFIKKREKSK